MQFLKTIGSHILDLVFPIFCQGCGKEGVYLCLDCARKIPRIEKQKCLICQKPSPFGRTHSECSKTKIDGLISALPYQHPLVKHIIDIFKYKFVDLSAILDEILLETINNHELKTFFQSFVMVPVPLHPRRLRWRGFNQSELLALKLEPLLEIPTSINMIKRTRFTKPQTKLNNDQRKTNVEGAFEAVDVLGKNILIIDDVVTTGSTINEMAKILKKKKAQQVWALTLAAG